jgi:hypothetical protein
LRVVPDTEPLVGWLRPRNLLGRGPAALLRNDIS